MRSPLTIGFRERRPWRNLWVGTTGSQTTGALELESTAVDFFELSSPGVEIAPPLTLGFKFVVDWVVHWAATDGCSV
jgi:hypothetical protein